MRIGVCMLTKDYRTIIAELEAYSPELADKPRVTVLNKIDALDPKTLSNRKRALEKAVEGPVFLMSGAAKKGVNEVLRALWAEISEDRAEAGDEGGAWHP